MSNILKKESSINTMNELAEKGKTLSPPKKLFGNFVLENSLVHFPSERGTGKSFFCMQLCLAISNNFKSFCDETIEKHGNTLYINCELNEDTVSRRLAKIYENPPEPILLENQHQAKVFTTRNNFSSNRAQIVSLIKELNPIFVVLDNWKTAFSDKETNKETTQAILDLLDLKDQNKFSFVVVDHTRKGSKLLLTDSDLQSGSGTKSDLADSDFFLRVSSQNKRYRILKRSKSRDCEEQDGAKLLLFNSETMWFECKEANVDESKHINQTVIKFEDKDEVLEFALLLHERGKTYDEIAEILGKPKTTVYRWLNK